MSYLLSTLGESLVLVSDEAPLSPFNDNLAPTSSELGSSTPTTIYYSAKKRKTQRSTIFLYSYMHILTQI